MHVESFMSENSSSQVQKGQNMNKVIKLGTFFIIVKFYLFQM